MGVPKTPPKNSKSPIKHHYQKALKSKSHVDVSRITTTPSKSRVKAATLGKSTLIRERRAKLEREKARKTKKKTPGYLQPKHF